MKVLVIISCVLLVICIASIYIIFIITQFADALRKKEGTARRNNLFLQRWILKAYPDSNFITSELIKRGYRRIYIYGAGMLGSILFNVIDKTQIEVVGFIDRSANEIGVGVPIYRLEMGNYDNADAVVVTVLKNMGSVVEAIKKQGNIDVILLDDLV